MRVAAEAIARARSDVDLHMARGVFLEAATLLENGLALDGLDEQDVDAVVVALWIDLVDAEPGAPVGARALAVQADTGDLLDPEGVAAAFLISAGVLRL